MHDPEVPLAIEAAPVTGSRIGLGGSVGGGRPRLRIPIVRIFIGLAAVLIVALALVQPTAPPTPAARGTADPFANPGLMAWSPDGALLAYVVQTRAPLGTDATAATGTSSAGVTSAAAGSPGAPGAPARVPFHVELWVVNADGTGNRLIDRVPPSTTSAWMWFAWSPDGRRLAVVQGDSLSLVSVDGGAPIPIRDGQTGWTGGLAWAPDGASLAYQRGDDNGSTGVWISRLDGTTTKLPLDATAGSPTWSPNGRLLAYSTSDPATGDGQTWVAQPDGTAPHLVGPCCLVGWTPSGDVYIDDSGAIRSYPVLGTGPPSDMVASSGSQLTPAGWIGQDGASITVDTPTGIRTLTSPGDVQLDGWFNPSPSGRYVAFLGHQAGRRGLFAVGTGGDEAISFLLPNVLDVGTWSPNDDVPAVAVAHDRAILVIDPRTSTVRTLVPRTAIAGPPLSVGTEAPDQLVIGPDGPEADIVTVSKAGMQQLLIVNDSDVAWQVSPDFDRSFCRGVGPDGSLGAFLGSSGPCLVRPHTTIAFVPGPGFGQGGLFVQAAGWPDGQDLRVILEPES